jgi:hypothetical protein
MWEDFAGKEKEKWNECYLSRKGDDGMENCVVKSECSVNYPGVCLID